MNEPSATPATPLNGVCFTVDTNKPCTVGCDFDTQDANERKLYGEVTRALTRLEIPFREYPERKQNDQHECAGAYMEAAAHVEIEGIDNIEKYKQAGGVLSQRGALADYAFQSNRNGSLVYNGSRSAKLRTELAKLGIHFFGGDRVIGISDLISIEAARMSGARVLLSRPVQR